MVRRAQWDHRRIVEHAILPTTIRERVAEACMTTTIDSICTGKLSKQSKDWFSSITVTTCSITGLPVEEEMTKRRRNNRNDITNDNTSLLGHLTGEREKKKEDRQRVSNQLVIRVVLTPKKKT